MGDELRGINLVHLNVKFSTAKAKSEICRCAVRREEHSVIEIRESKSI